MPSQPFIFGVVNLFLCRRSEHTTTNIPLGVYGESKDMELTYRTCRFLSCYGGKLYMLAVGEGRPYTQRKTEAFTAFPVTQSSHLNGHEVCIFAFRNLICPR